MSGKKTIGEYLYKIAWLLDKKGAEALKKEGDSAQKSVTDLGKSLNKAEKEAKDFSAAGDKAARSERDVGTAARQSAKDLEKAQSATKRLSESFNGYMKAALSFMAIRRAFSAIVSTATQMDALANAAAAVGASASGMARLAYAADLAGVNAAEMEIALKGVRQTAAQAAAGIGAGAKAWALIGIKTRDENGTLKDTTKLIDELGVKFAQMDEGRAQALGKLLKMTPAVIGALRSGMMSYGKEYDKMLGKMTPSFEEGVKAAQEMHAAQSRLLRISQLLWQGIVGRLFRQIGRAFDRIRRAFIENQAAVSSFATTVLYPLAAGFDMLAHTITFCSRLLSLFHEALGDLSGPAEKILVWGGAFLLLLKKIGKASLLASLGSPFFRIAAGIILVLLLLEDLYVAMKGGRSAINWKPAIEFFKKIKDKGKSIVDWFKALPDRIGEAVESIRRKFVVMWTALMTRLGEMWDAFIRKVTGWMPDPVKKAVGIVELTPEEQRHEAVRKKAEEIFEAKYLLEDGGFAKAVAEAEQLIPKAQAQAQGPLAPATGDETAAPIIKGAAPAPLQVAAAAVDRLVESRERIEQITKVASAGSNIASSDKVLSSAPVLGQNVTNNIDSSKSVSVDMPVTNSTTINVQTTATEPDSIASQVGRAVDESNEALIRNLQSPIVLMSEV